MKRLKFFKLLKNNMGISLVEVMVAAGMVGALSLAILEINQQMQQTSKSANQRMTAGTLSQRIQMVINKKADCEASFGGATVRNDGATPEWEPVDNMVRSGQNMWVRNDDSFIEDEVEVTDVRIGKYSDTSEILSHTNATGDNIMSSSAMVMATVRRTSTSGREVDYTREFPIIILRNATSNTVEGCISTDDDTLLAVCEAMAFNTPSNTANPSHFPGGMAANQACQKILLRAPQTPSSAPMDGNQDAFIMTEGGNIISSSLDRDGSATPTTGVIGGNIISNGGNIQAVRSSAINGDTSVQAGGNISTTGGSILAEATLNGTTLEGGNIIADRGVISAIGGDNGGNWAKGSVLVEGGDITVTREASVAAPDGGGLISTEGGNIIAIRTGNNTGEGHITASGGNLIGIANSSITSGTSGGNLMLTGNGSHGGRICINGVCKSGLNHSDCESSTVQRGKNDPERENITADCPNGKYLKGFSIDLTPSNSRYIIKRTCCR